MQPSKYFSVTTCYIGGVGICVCKLGFAENFDVCHSLFSMGVKPLIAATCSGIIVQHKSPDSVPQLQTTTTGRDEFYSMQGRLSVDMLFNEELRIWTLQSKHHFSLPQNRYYSSEFNNLPAVSTLWSGTLCRIVPLHIYSTPGTVCSNPSS